MLRSLVRFFKPAPRIPAPVSFQPKPGVGVLLFADVEGQAKVGPALPASYPEPVAHRERVMAMKLEHAQLCSSQRAAQFRELGVASAGELAAADPSELAAGFKAPRRATRLIRRFRRAIRFAASVPGMMPQDAHLLISVHRRTIQALALETPAALHRDLQRFAESTPGRRQLRGRRIPSVKRLRRWIKACSKLVSAEAALLPKAVPGTEREHDPFSQVAVAGTASHQPPRWALPLVTA